MTGFWAIVTQRCAQTTQSGVHCPSNVSLAAFFRLVQVGVRKTLTATPPLVHAVHRIQDVL